MSASILSGALLIAGALIVVASSLSDLAKAIRMAEGPRLIADAIRQQSRQDHSYPLPPHSINGELMTLARVHEKLANAVMKLAEGEASK